MTKTPEDVEKPTETVPNEKPVTEDLAKATEVVEKKKEERKPFNRRQRGRGRGREKPVFDKEKWTPKTDLGKRVKRGEIKDINELLSTDQKILEPEIIDALMPELESELLLIGQSKGKFGGGARRIFKQTQKKTKEGNKPKFTTAAAAGNKKGCVGIGYGKSKETVPAREKSIRNAKLNIIEVPMGCGSWQCKCGKAHTIPFATEGKAGSVELKLMPAPVGTGLCAPSECAKILKLAGITDIWSKTKGKTKNRQNMIDALMKALRKLSTTKVQEIHKKKLSISEGVKKDE